MSLTVSLFLGAGALAGAVARPAAAGCPPMPDAVVPARGLGPGLLVSRGPVVPGPLDEPCESGGLAAAHNR